MSSSRQTLTLAGAILALISGALICSYGSEAKEKTGYQKLLPKLDTAPAPKKLQGKVGMAEILRPNDVGNPWGYLPFGGKLPQTVSQVVPGSPAFAGGLQQSDKILEAQIDKSRAQLVVERAGKKYSCTLTFNDRRTPQKDQPLDSTTARKLADHQIVLLIDSSASMRSKDCPGGSSRWDWCRGQATRLYSDCAEMFKNKIFA